MQSELIVGNTTDLWLKGLKWKRDGAFVNDASPVATVYDANGTPVENGENLALAHVADSDGDYLGTLPADAGIVLGAKYVIEFRETTIGYRDKLVVVAKDGSGD